jgi:hypothetical protein
MGQVVQASTITDAEVLGAIGALLLILIGIIGFFVKHWMTTTDKREFRALDLIESVNDSLSELNGTLSKVNTNLEVYQASMDGTIANIRDTMGSTCRTTETHGKTIQDHEIRLTVIEKTKSHENFSSR